jgi:hypothetical protein
MGWEIGVSQGRNKILQNKTHGIIDLLKKRCFQVERATFISRAKKWLGARRRRVRFG